MNTFTEADLLAALRRRFTESGNGGGGRYAFLTHVRTGAAWEQQEIDGVAFCLWPSDRHSLMAFEVKVSRSDWLHEIRPDTSKSERARQLCDSFTVVAPVGIVRPEELPAGWGVGHFDGRFIKRYMPRLHARLDHATLDIGQVRRLLEYAGQWQPMSEGKNHRALDDIQLHLREAIKYRSMLAGTAHQHSAKRQEEA